MSGFQTTNYVFRHIDYPFRLCGLLETNSLKFPSEIMWKQNGRKTVARHEPPNRPFSKLCHCLRNTGAASHTYYWVWVALARR